MSHYKIHLGQLTQNTNNNELTSPVASTTTTNKLVTSNSTNLPVTSATNGINSNASGKILKTPKTSPTSSTSSPKLYPQSTLTPASLYNWQNAAVAQQQQMRYHPYMKMTSLNAQQVAIQQQQAVQQQQQQQFFYEMVAAMGMPGQAAAAAMHSQLTQASEKQV